MLQTETSPATSDSERGSSLAVCILLPAIVMSLGWGLRGTIGGGSIGAMIPGAMITLCLCHLLRKRQDVGLAVAFGAVGVGLGGQETYGQTIGFLRESQTVFWGVTGLAVKGAMWGLSGGAVLGLGLMRGRYSRREIVIGFVLMIIGTILGWVFVDQPKWLYFSNRLDNPREEVWVGLTLGALFLLVSLGALRREAVSPAFAGWGALFGGLGFGGGGALVALGFSLPQPYRGWPWWKNMEFSFGLLFGIGLAIACYRNRHALREMDRADGSADRDPLSRYPENFQYTVGVLLVCGSLWLQFNIPLRIMYSVLGPLLLAVTLFSETLAWHVALSLTVLGFCRDFLNESIKREWLAPEYGGWLPVLAMTIPVVALTMLTRRTRRPFTTARYLVGLTWLATFFGLLKACIPTSTHREGVLVPVVFFAEAVAVTLLVRFCRSQPLVPETLR